MTQRRQVLIAGVASVLVTVMFFLLLLNPKLGQIADARADLAGSQEQAEQLRSEIRRLEEVRRNTTETTNRLSVLTEYLPSSSDLPGFIRQVQEVATKAGVDLRSISPGTPADLESARGIQSITLSLSVRGSFHRVEDLLTRIEGPVQGDSLTGGDGKLRRVLEVTALSLAPVTDDLTGALVLDATVQALMYVVQPDASLTGAGSGRTTVRNNEAAE